MEAKLSLFKIVIKLTKDFIQNFNDHQRKFDIIEIIAETLDSSFSLLDSKVIKAVVSLLNGSSEGIQYLLEVLMPDTSEETRNKMILYLDEAKNLLDINLADKLILPPSQGKSQKRKKNQSEGLELDYEEHC